MCYAEGVLKNRTLHCIYGKVSLPVIGRFLFNFKSKGGRKTRSCTSKTGRLTNKPDIFIVTVYFPNEGSSEGINVDIVQGEPVMVNISDEAEAPLMPPTIQSAPPLHIRKTSPLFTAAKVSEKQFPVIEPE